ncbi:iron chelate uptake ABC transporter, FeCT family, permease protein [gut metagenome]|uniref:Iron chelate uptake ABC transporter, FeCT family, permease protein n=1 Tax=gut metagenome TaxID=749906 RepID=J9GM26_9ZZZZ
MKYSLLFLLLCGLAAANLFLGSVSLAPSAIIDVLVHPAADNSIAHYIVWESRLPQLLTALLSGCALALSGLVMQTVFANPLADPSILGVSSGASLGAALAMLLLGGSWTLSGMQLSGYLLTIAAAFFGAMAVIFILLVCSSLLRNPLLLLITGVMISFAVASIVSLLSFFATAEGVRSYVIWGLGDFSGVTLDRLPVFAALLLPALGALFLLAKPLNALLLGDDYAANLGVPVVRVRTLLLFLTGWLTAIVTALCGPIAFIGLAVPHLARLTLHTANHRQLLPVTLLCGGNVALACNLLAHLPGQGGLLPLNAITPLVGVPVVLYILFGYKDLNG